MRYSPATNGFYPEEIDYGDSLPGDVIEITDALYGELLTGQDNGKVITPNGRDLPYLSDRPEPTHDELISMANVEKQRRIDQANAYMYGKQWPGKAAIGRLAGDELAQYNLWLDYLDELEAIDTSAAPDITWPSQPAE
ncbi:phage tail fiber assembly protein [Trabulsiella guamensis ATCC 49490]|uniref:Phage tail fiber assembly protein n=1 Tax=Trabulsiella guamensis ATCC 49490 TaxID=1005994 RepID=A0A085ADP0_9ENTR|nr:tail assembly chaperone [Trabulsiella guamensis]KFC08335.1 phage tail fiber assembly protein [Trabulsiella guamensis ATCC 49490]